MRQHANVDWTLPIPRLETWEQAGIAVLMDIRDELQKLNALLGCHNFVSIPTVLRSIRRNTSKPRPKRRKAA